MTKIDERKVVDLFEKEDSYKELLLSCTTESQKNQVNSKLSNIYKKLENIYIN